MDERQLAKMNRQNIAASDKAIDYQEEDSAMEIAEWTAFGLALGFVLVSVGFFLFNRYYK